MNSDKMLEAETYQQKFARKCAAKKAAFDAMSLATRANTPEDMLVNANMAIDKYMEYMEYQEHSKSCDVSEELAIAKVYVRCAQIDMKYNAKRAEEKARLAQLELDKHPIQRWFEQYWDLFF